jgi:hypothetical protein
MGRLLVPFLKVGGLTCVGKKCLGALLSALSVMALSALTLRTDSVRIGCVAEFGSNARGSNPGTLLSRDRTRVLAGARPPIQKETNPLNGLDMYLKKGASIRGLKPEMVAALIILSDLTAGDFVVTSGTDPHPKRVPTSLHPKGLAIDVRIPFEATPPNSLRDSVAWKQLVSHAFEDTEFQLVWYDTHVHIEFDPR